MSGALRVVEARIRGRVQGVGFRWFVARSARALGVTGWVRNADDGEVEVRAAGDAARVGELLQVLRRGPPHAMVRSVEVQDLPGTMVDVNAEFEIIP